MNCYCKMNSLFNLLDGYGNNLNPLFNTKSANGGDRRAGACAYTLFDVGDTEPDEYGVLGRRQDNEEVYFNVHEPFCAVAVGLQGAGKSHTMGVLLENCVVPTLPFRQVPVVKLEEPMSALVLHYGNNPKDACETLGLATPRVDGVVDECPLVTVMVSPAYYWQRRQLYDALGYRVVPLLFRWNELDAVQLRRLMRLGDGDTQLYADVMLGILRQHQRRNEIPTVEEFERLVLEQCDSPAQERPLRQRFALMRQFLHDADENKDLRQHAANAQLACVAGSGCVVIADLTDPLLSAADANGVFQVLLGQYRDMPMDCGKVLLCDEAHRYFGGGKTRGLEDLVVDSVRLMRHEGMRVMVSSQSPMTLPPELLELSTVVMCHRFQSPEWYRCLSSTVRLPPDGFERIRTLGTGYAMLVQSSGVDPCIVRVRHRLTVDRGATRSNGAISDAKVTCAAAQKRTVVQATTKQPQPLQQHGGKKKKKKNKKGSGGAPNYKSCG